MRSGCLGLRLSAARQEDSEQQVPAPALDASSRPRKALSERAGSDRPAAGALAPGHHRGDFHWHEHGVEDEFFLVLDRQLLIDLEDRETVTLDPHQGYTLLRGVVHRTRARSGRQS